MRSVRLRFALGYLCRSPFSGASALVSVRSQPDNNRRGSLHHDRSSFCVRALSPSPHRTENRCSIEKAHRSREIEKLLLFGELNLERFESARALAQSTLTHSIQSLATRTSRLRPMRKLFNSICS